MPGGHLLAHLSGTAEVVAWSRSVAPDDLATLARWQRVDLLDRASVRAALAEARPSRVYHCAGMPNVAQSWEHSTDALRGNVLATQVFDVGVTEYGTPGNPVVYAKCDEGAEKTLLIYWMYDTMPVTQPDAWTYPPFEGRLVEQAPYKKVLIGRGATNSKGPQMSQLNALRAIKAVHGKLPVNVIFVAEGDEERMDIGLRKFVKDHPELLATTSDHAHFRLTNSLVDARSVLLDGPSDLGQATYLLSSGACCAVP